MFNEQVLSTTLYGFKNNNNAGPVYNMSMKVSDEKFPKGSVRGSSVDLTARQSPFKNSHNIVFDCFKNKLMQSPKASPRYNHN